VNEGRFNVPRGRPKGSTNANGLTNTSAPKRVKSEKTIRFSSPAALDAHVWNICNVLRRSGSSGAMQYVPELSWILFLRILDEREHLERQKAEAVGRTFTPSVSSPFRWRDWGSKPQLDITLEDAVRGEQTVGWKRHELIEGGTLNAFYAWVNDTLIPHLKNLKNTPNATARMKVISEILSGVERTRIDTERNLLDVLDMVDQINSSTVDETHVFALSQVFEGLLLKMGDKGNDGGQFFTPREVVRVMVRFLNPGIEDTVYDPCSGTGGFLAEAFGHILTHAGDNLTPEQLERLRTRVVFGREKENQIYPIALANLVLHGVDRPAIWHGNTLTRATVYDGLFQDAPAQYSVVLTNPPFGGKENEAAQTDFVFKTSATQVLFLQHIIDSLAPGGRCAVVLDEGVSFRLETAFVQTKRKILNECRVDAILSLPPGTFVNAGAGVKTNVFFFTKLKPGAKPPETIWYYDLSDVKVGKRTPLTMDRFEEFLTLKDTRVDSDRSWTVDIAARRRAAKTQSDQLRAEADGIDTRAKTARDALKTERAAHTPDRERVTNLELEIRALEVQARELRAKAQAIDDAVYDLKAVNPNARAVVDERTPADLLEVIHARGLEVNAALEALRAITPEASVERARPDPG
jgi:type I restriction enzyme M protein